MKASRNYTTSIKNDLKKKIRLRRELSERTVKDYISASNKNLSDIFHSDELEEIILDTEGDWCMKVMRLLKSHSDQINLKR